MEVSIEAPPVSHDDDHVPKNLFKLPFRLILYGASSSGKTNVIRNLLSKRLPYHDIFGRNVFWFSETASLKDPSMPVIREENLIQGFDTAKLQALWDEQNSLIAEYGKKKAPHILCVLDDTVCSFTDSKGSILRRLFMTGRHSKISLICTSQSYKSIPKAVRCNASDAIFFEMNGREVTAVCEEQSIKCDRFYDIFADATGEPYSFLTIHMSSHVSQRYQKRLTNSFYTV